MRNTQRETSGEVEMKSFKRKKVEAELKEEKSKEEEKLEEALK